MANNLNIPTGNEENSGAVPATGGKEELIRKLEDVKNRDAALQTRKIASANQLKQLKIKILGEIFSFLKTLGVDPSNLESINGFLQSLERQDPDLLTMFESAINSLSPDVGMPTMPEEKPKNLMDKFSGLQKQILRK